MNLLKSLYCAYFNLINKSRIKEFICFDFTFFIKRRFEISQPF